MASSAGTTLARGGPTPAPSSPAIEGLRRRWFAEGARDVQLTRFVLLRGLGLLYCIAFAILVQQVRAVRLSRG